MCVLGLAPIWLPTLCVAYFGLTVKLRDVRPVRHQTARIGLSVSPYIAGILLYEADWRWPLAACGILAGGPEPTSTSRANRRLATSSEYSPSGDLTI